VPCTVAGRRIAALDKYVGVPRFDQETITPEAAALVRKLMADPVRRRRAECRVVAVRQPGNTADIAQVARMLCDEPAEADLVR